MNSSYRAWLLLACVRPLSYYVKIAWLQLLLIWQRWCVIHVEIDSLHAQTLFDAVVERIEQVAEVSKETCSCDVEGMAIYDKKLGRTEIHMRCSSKEARTINLPLAPGRKLTARFTRGDDDICGRDHVATMLFAVATMLL